MEKAKAIGIFTLKDIQVCSLQFFFAPTPPQMVLNSSQETNEFFFLPDTYERNSFVYCFGT